jgi:hypothetical protein
MNTRKRIFHIVESFEGGIITFIAQLVKIKTVDHVVIYGDRIKDIEKKLPESFYHQNVSKLLICLKICYLENI